MPRPGQQTGVSGVVDVGLPAPLVGLAGRTRTEAGPPARSKKVWPSETPWTKHQKARIQGIG